MKETLQYLVAGNKLTKAQAYEALQRIGKGECNNSQITVFLTVYMMRSITPEELSGFREAFYDLCVKVDLSDFDTIDLCGTGGDGKHTFNISTLTSFVLAGAGYKVVKHGNYGVSSGCGSSNIMEHLGLRFTNDTATLQRQMQQAGICYFHAPMFHPAMKNVGPIRKELGMKTFFNMLGPLINPANPNNQLVGVYSTEVAALYGAVYAASNKRYTIVHSSDGYDEISLTAPFTAVTRAGVQQLDASYFGFETIQHQQIAGGETVEESAKIFMQILNGQGTQAQNNVVCANAAMAIQTITDAPIQQCLAQAQQSITDRKALHALKALVAV